VILPFHLPNFLTMRKDFYLLIVLTALFLHPTCQIQAQNRGILTGADILTKSISYHDPQNHWDTFEGTLYLKGKLPIGKETYTVITFNNSFDFYQATRKINGRMITSGVREGSCFAQIDGDPQLSSDLVEKYHLECEEVLSMRNYHTHMIGIPMQLHNSSTTIHERIHTVSFQGRSHYQVKVSTDPALGAQTWYFYINPQTYAVAGYRFERLGDEDSGEYVVLSDEINIEGLHIPKTRKWYTNDDVYLGTDELMVGKYFYTPPEVTGK